MSQESLASEQFSLSNSPHGHLHATLNAHGQGALFLDWVALTRGPIISKAADPGHGPLLFCRDTVSQNYDSVGHAAVPNTEYRLHVGIDPTRDIEWRCLEIVNSSDCLKTLEITSYTEVALNHPMGDAGHPAFSKLFVQTACDEELPMLTARRRARGHNENWPWLAQRCFGPMENVTWESDRARFVGRGRRLAEPAAMDAPGSLSNTTGNVLDPIFAWRGSCSVPAQSSHKIWFATAAAGNLSAVRAILATASPPASCAGMTLCRPTPCRAAPIKSPMEAHADCQQSLRHPNGYGGFSEDGREYVIELSIRQGRLDVPPMPWINVLANPRFGCLVSERGAGYTWARNSQANRLTPWSNDPILDPHGEALYVADSDSGLVWSPLPGPCPPQSACVVRHGFGYSRFDSVCHGLAQSVTFCVPPEDPVKLLHVRLHNTSDQPRRLACTSYHSLILGAQLDSRDALRAWTDADGVQRAENPGAGDFAGAQVFCGTQLHGPSPTQSLTCNQASRFFGAGDISEPDFARASDASAISGAVGTGNEACFASRTAFSLAPGATADWVIVLGETLSADEQSALIARYLAAAAMATSIQQTQNFWQQRLEQIHIETPLPAIDTMVNGWLLYQNLACRIWGRSAFYQSGGAYGFRDQLQDSSALAMLQPDIMRAQILRHAAHQFPEGDVLHWWHPEPMERGMRTLFSDDLLWLPYLTGHYVQVTGDTKVLDEVQPFILAPLLAPGEDERYLKPDISDEAASVFEHCCRSIDKSLTRGAHGLPLMGIGDWNDGMSRIGREGRGESVWLGFFLVHILDRWIPMCTNRGENTRASRYAAYRAELLQALDTTGWDGSWYRRAYYDDGTPLGTSTDSECRIDALAQAWAVISGVASPARARLALDALHAHLIDDQNGLIRLLTPPFVDTPHDPGYIKGYVAGVRENGGQYTHAACWVVRAMAEAGRAEQAVKLLEKLNPIWHARDRDAVARYQVEPYVVAADIYGAEPHIGRGGWTWYTGSAGWMFRVTVESILGFRMDAGTHLVLAPSIPASWPGFSIRFQVPGNQTIHHIRVARAAADVSAPNLIVDGNEQPLSAGLARWPVFNDNAPHHIVYTVL